MPKGIGNLIVSDGFYDEASRWRECALMMQKNQQYQENNFQRIASLERSFKEINNRLDKVSEDQQQLKESLEKSDERFNSLEKSLSRINVATVKVESSFLYKVIQAADKMFDALASFFISVLSCSCLRGKKVSKI